MIIQEDDAEAVLVRKGCVLVGYDHKKGKPKSQIFSIAQHFSVIVKMFKKTVDMYCSCE